MLYSLFSSICTIVVVGIDAKIRPCFFCFVSIVCALSWSALVRVGTLFGGRSVIRKYFCSNRFNGICSITLLSFTCMDSIRLLNKKNRNEEFLVLRAAGKMRERWCEWVYRLCHFFQHFSYSRHFPPASSTLFVPFIYLIIFVVLCDTVALSVRMFLSFRLELYFSFFSLADHVPFRFYKYVNTCHNY